MTGGEVKDIAADKKVILVARAIASPKVLMLSGVGEGNALRSPGIRVIENLLGQTEQIPRGYEETFSGMGSLILSNAGPQPTPSWCTGKGHEQHSTCHRA
jgi:hypothetical protein